MEAIVVYALLNKKIKALISGISNIVAISGGLRFTTNLGVNIDVALPVHTHSNLETILEKFTLDAITNELLFDGQPISGNGIMKDWVLNEHYNLHQAIVYNGSIYRAKNDIANSTTTPDVDVINFEAIGSGSVNLKDLEDVEFTMLTDGQVSVYDNVLGKWINKTLKHDDLADKNGNTDFLHITKTEKDKFIGYEVIIDDHETRISALEAGGLPSGGLTIANDSILNSQTKDYHTITQAKFKITGWTTGDVVSIFDPSKITGNPSNIINNITIQDVGAIKYLVVDLQNLTYGQNYKIIVSPMCLVNNSTVMSASSFICSFNTLSAPSEPFIGDSLLEGQHNLDIIATNKISFPITHGGALALVNGNRYSCTPVNIVDGMFTLNGDNLEANLHNVELDREYTLSILSDIVSNNIYTLNSAGNSDTFSTACSVPFINQSALHSNMSVDNSTIHKVDYTCGTPTGRGNGVIKDSSKITITQGSATISSVVLSGTTLSVMLNNEIDGDTIGIKIDKGAIANQDAYGNFMTNDVITDTTFKFLVHEPVITQTILNTNQDVNIGLSEITYAVSSTLTPTVDITKVHVTPNIINGTPIISGGYLRIPVSGCVENQIYNITLDADAILNGGINGNDTAITSSFRISSAEPIIGVGSLDGNGGVDYLTVNECVFSITASDTVTINPSNIELTENGVNKPISSANYISGLLHVGFTLLSNKSYVLKVKANSVESRNTWNTVSTQTCSFSTANTFSVSNSLINGTRISNSTTSISFPIVNANGSVTIIDNTKITCSANINITSSTISGSDLIVNVNGLDYSESASVTISQGAIKDSVMVNQNSTPIVCAFTIIGDTPVISQSSINTNQHVTLGTTFVEYPITASGVVTITDASKVYCPVGYPNVISSKSITGTTGSYKLRIGLSTLSNNVNYQIQIDSGLLSNDTTLSANTLTTDFKTIFANPIVVQNATLNNSWQDKSLVSIEYDITSSDVVLIDNASNITISGGATIINKTIIGGKLHLDLSSVNYSQTLTINIGINSVKNSDGSNNSGLTTIIKINGDDLMIGSSSIDGTTVSQGLTSVSFPITTVHGGSLGSVITIDNAKVHCNDGGIIASSSVVGSNLVLTLNALAYNTSYTFTLDANTLTNDNNNVSNAKTCTITTMQQAPIVGMPTVNGIKIDKSTTSITFPITVNGTNLVILNSALITKTGGFTLGTATISGNNLIIPISGLTYSTDYSITIPSGVIKNLTTSNSNSITVDFRTKGDLISIANSTLDGNLSVDKTTTTNIDFNLSNVSGIYGNMTLDSSKIVCSPNAISGTIAVIDDGGIKKLRTPVTLNAGTSYTISISAGAINNDDTLSADVVSCAFTTSASGVSIDWTFEFTLPNANYEYNLSSDSNWVASGHTLLTTDLVGMAYDGVGSTAELKYIGYVGNLVYAPNGVVVPRAGGVDTYSPITDVTRPDGGYTFDDSVGIFTFESGSPSPKLYRIVKYL